VSYQAHVNSVYSKARQRSRTLSCVVLHRAGWIVSLCAKPSLRTFVQHCTEYNDSVRNPCRVHFIDLLKNVQRDFSKQFPSLSSNISRASGTSTTKVLILRIIKNILHNLTPFSPDSLLSIYYYIHSLNPLDSISLTNKSLYTDVAYALVSPFFCRSIQMHAWNILPSNLLHAPSTSVFKRAVKCICLSRFFKQASV
jgi:hypothetical protein